MSRNTSPARYLPVQLRDVAVGPFALFLTVAVVLTVVVWRFLQNRPDIMSGPQSLITGTMMVVQTVAVLFAAGGVAGADIQRGYYRAYFSKPITPWWFYLQRWLLGGVAFLMIPVLLSLGMALVFGDTPWLPAGLVGNFALVYLMVGSVVLLAANFLERDWLVAFLVTFLQAQLHGFIGLFETMGQEVNPVLLRLDAWLPPFHLASPSTTMLAGRDLVHVLAYGGGMLVLALLLLRHRPLGSGGRA